MKSTVDDRIQSLEATFESVFVNPALGREFVAAQLERHKVGDEVHTALLRAMPEAVEVIATDDAHSDARFLKLVLLPGMPTVVVFMSDVHRQASESLLVRLRTALGGEIEVTDSARSPLTRKRLGAA